MVKEYEISVPVLGVAHVTVMADSEESALSQAINEAGPDDVDEWYALKAVVEGNVFYGPLNNARVDGVYDPDEPAQ
jgi:hypothetical protein